MNARKPSFGAAILLAVAFAPVVPAQTGVISTIAGNGTAGTAGVGGLAVNAQLSGAGGVAVDQSDNVYVADSRYHRVVRVEASTGILTLVAGNGIASSAGDGGPASQASLSAPYGVAFDPAGNLLIVEFGGARVRRVDAMTGIITTVAGNGIPAYSGDGGPAVSASLQSPTSIAVDAAGNLYIADSGNARVRRVDAQFGYITTVAGNGASGTSPDGTPAVSASLNAPFGISLDHWGNLLISEPNNGKIRNVSPSGILYTLAGNGATGFTGDNVRANATGIGHMGVNVASDSGGNLFFADGTGRIRRIDAATGTIATVAGNGSGAQGQSSSGGGGGGGCYNEPLGDGGPASIATLDGGFSVALTGNGNLVFSDWLDCRVRRVYLPSPSPYTNTTLAVPPINVSAPATLTATVTPVAAGGVPTGSVQFVYQPANLAPVVLGSAGLANGTASLTVQGPSAPGSFPIVAYYSGDSSYNGSGSPMAPLIVSYPSGAIVTLTSSQNPTAANTPVTFTATVSAQGAQPTGSVEFDNGGAAMGRVNLVNGVAQFTVAFPNPGTLGISALYSGDANYGTVRSAPLNQTVNATPTTTALGAAPASAIYGQPVQLTATVAPGAATGTVNFLDLNVSVGGAFYSSLSLGTATLNGGAAVLTLSNLSAGTHTIKASYLGDGNYAGSVSAIISVTIAQVTPVLTVSSSLNPSQPTDGVTFTATLTPVSQGGTLMILDGQNIVSGPSTWTPGRVTVTTGTLTVGRHSITATWSGDANVAAGTSTALTQTVQGATTTLVSAGAGPFPYGQPVTLTATVSPNAAGGTVQFTDGATTLGTGTISGGTATLTLSSLLAGTHSIAASYAGDGVYLASSGSTSLPIDKAGTSVALSASPNPALSGQAATFTATVTPPAATGSVQFRDGATVLGSVAVAGGTASLSTATLASGDHAITAVYSGDSNFNTSASAAVTETVKTDTTTTISSSPNPSVAGQSIALSASIAPASATGTVQFLDGATVLGTAAVANGAAGIAVNSLAAGSHSITAVYSGDGSYNGSASAALAQVVKTASSTTLQSDTPAPVYAQTVRLISTVSPGAATGTVQFLDGATPLGTVPVSGGTAVLSIATLSTGSHTISAAYSGDASYGSSASAPMALTVAKATAAISASSSPNPSVAGQVVTFSATVAPPSATGSVQFVDGATVLGTAALNNGVATFSTAALVAGSHSITAAYSGDANYTGASATVSETVKATTATSLSASSAAVFIGQPVQLTASLAPASATGTVQFLDGGAVLGTSTVNGGTAAISVSLPLGAHTITAVYGGDANDAGSTSAAVTVTVSKINASVALTSSLNPALWGKTVSFTATVNPPSATGSVQFLDGATVLATVALSGNTAAVTVSNLAVGTHTITAVYGGDPSDTAATSPALSETVNPNPPAAPSNLTASPVSASQINLAWRASATAGVAYNVYASTTQNFTPSIANQIAAGLTTLSYSHTGLAPKTTWYYRVTAQNGGGESAPSNQANATTKPH